MINKIRINIQENEIVYLKSGGKISVYKLTDKRHKSLRCLNGYYVSANVVGKTAYVLRNRK